MITDLPQELIYHILSFILAVDPRQSLILQLVCGRFYDTLHDGYTWDRYIAKKTTCTIRNKMDFVIACGKRTMPIHVSLFEKDSIGKYIAKRHLTIQVSPALQIWALCACYIAGHLGLPPRRLKYRHGGKKILRRGSTRKPVIEISSGNFSDPILIEVIRG